MSVKVRPVKSSSDGSKTEARDLDSISSQAILNDVQFLTVEGRFEEAREENTPEFHRLKKRIGLDR